MANFKLHADYGEAMMALTSLIRNAKECIYYSCFTCKPEEQIYGEPAGTNLVSLLWDAWKHSKKKLSIYILYNYEPWYGMPHPKKLQELLPPYPSTQIKVVTSTGKLSYMLKPLLRNLRYSNHHQKYLFVDNKYALLSGTEIHNARTGWLVANANGYYWHETAVEFECSREMASFFVHNYHYGPDYFLSSKTVNKPQFPLCTAWDENRVLCQLINNAKKHIHIENQSICSVIGVSSNTVFLTLAKRLVKAYKHTNNDLLCCTIISNVDQPDEANIVTLWTKHSFYASVASLIFYCTNQGVSTTFLTKRLVIATMCHNNNYIKVHSNFTLIDGQYLYRSSSNLNDRCLNKNPCDSEIGVLVSEKQVVSSFQQKILSMYLYGELASYPYFFNTIKQQQNKTTLKLVKACEYVSYNRERLLLMRVLQKHVAAVGGVANSKNIVKWNAQLHTNHKQTKTPSIKKTTVNINYACILFGLATFILLIMYLKNKT